MNFHFLRRRQRNVFALLLLARTLSLTAAELHVSPSGNDANPGTAVEPIATFAAARKAVRALREQAVPVTVWFHSGTYYLPETVVFTPEDSGSARARILYATAPGEKAVLSGGSRLALAWEPYRDGIFRASVPENFTTDQLFVNGRRQPMARYPNFDPAILPFNGYAADAFSTARAARWADPRGGYIHAMHRHEWGDFHYRITGKDAAGKVTYEGGWQNNRRLGMHDQFRMVENIFEELDAPGEWFHDPKTHTLYYYPEAGTDLANSAIESVRLRHLVEFRGTVAQPVRFLTLRGFTFCHASRTFMENREPLLRSDWTTYRGGAVLFDGTEDCALEDSFFDQVGGNAVFVNNYNRRVAIRGCHIKQAGANGIAFVGSPAAVRSPLFEYGQRQSLAQIDRAPGPKSADYPADCVVEDCLIHETGRVEKQTAPIQIEMSQGITILHCSLYDVPRAGINIGSGCWGGHVIEFCDIFDTVKETGDHGSFNSWGRDRYWGLTDVDLNRATAGNLRDLPRLDMVKPTVLRNNRWRCDHGWDIDLDDGSSSYEIRDNLCLNGGIKNREGFYRVVENNIMVNNSFHPHVWYGGSEDIFSRNIVFTTYRPIEVKPPWGRECDFNLLHQPGAEGTAPATALQKESGRDEHSLVADAQFVNPTIGDYRVKAGSPALALGFRNFPMDQFGVRSASLRAIARTPQLPEAAPSPAKRSQCDSQAANWRGARVRNVVGDGEVSAYGLPGETGVLVLEVASGSVAAGEGLKPSDVILSLDGAKVASLADLLRLEAARTKSQTAVFTVLRGQREVRLTLRE